MTKATFWPRISDRGQRSAFVLRNLGCFSALRDFLSAPQLGRDDFVPEFPAVIHFADVEYLVMASSRKARDSAVLIVLASMGQQN